jgi:hypothetical protein
MSQPAFQAKVERCKQLARERDDTVRTGTAALINCVK